MVVSLCTGSSSGSVFAASRIEYMVFVDVCMMKQAALVWFDDSWRWKPFWRGNIFLFFVT
jgi:hypothetical protein